MTKISPFFTLALASALVLGAAANAQTPTPGTAPAAPASPASPAPKVPAVKGPEELVNHMRETLNLTDVQADKIKGLIIKSREEFHGLMENPKIPAEEKRTKLHDAMKKGMAQIGDVLTPEQLKKWNDDMRKAETARRQTPSVPPLISPSTSAPAGAAPSTAAPSATTPAEKKP